MTTIAWDGMTLAADTRGVVGESLIIESHKVSRLADGRLYAACGRMADLLLVRDWLTAGGEKPAVDDTFAALLIETSGQAFRLEEKLIPVPLWEPFHACGSGRDFALAAMALGQTAAAAVLLAMRFDIWTGGHVESVTLETPHA